MSESDGTPRRRPPTIDLTAKEVDVEQQAGSKENSATTADAANDRAGTQDVPGSRASRNSSSRATPYAIGAVTGAIAVAAIVAGIWMAGLLPSHETAAATSTSAPAGAQGAKIAGADEISSRLDRIQEALQAPRPEPALATRVTATEAQTKSLGESIAALTRRIDEVAAAAQSALAQAKTAAAAAEAAKAAAHADVQRRDIDALNSRIAALENAVKSLSVDVTRPAAGVDDRAARATVAAEALRSAVERGAPYQAELAAVTSLGAEQNAVAPLAPFAADGVPNTAALGRELSALMPALWQAAGTTPSGSSLLGRLEAHAQRLVRITPTDGAEATAPAGNDASALIARINGEAERGDIDAALADIARLPDAARAVAEGWVKKAEARAAAIAASRSIAAAALAALSKPVSQ
jgi:hypothetical protein